MDWRWLRSRFSPLNSRFLLPSEVGSTGYARGSNEVLLNECGVDKMYDKLSGSST
jgi:hypothetical protein